MYLWSVLFLALNLLVAMSDFRLRRVPNRLLISALTLQVIWLLSIGQSGTILWFGVVRWDQALTGFGLGLIMFYPLWRFRAVGAGDVKFIAVLGFLLGPTGLFPVLLIGSVACGLHAVGMVVVQGWAPARLAWRSGSPTRRGVPYAAYLALAAVAWLAWKVSEEGLLR